MKDPDPLNLRPDDPMTRWRRDANRAEEERRAAQRELRQSSEHDTVTHLRADMQHEIANLRSELVQQKELIFEAVGQALGQYGDKLCDHLEKAIQKLQNEVFSEIARKSGEAMGRIDALAPGARSYARSSSDFKFSNECDDEKGIVDLPNPLTPVVRKTTLN